MDLSFADLCLPTLRLRSNLRLLVALKAVSGVLGQIGQLVKEHAINVVQHLELEHVLPQRIIVHVMEMLLKVKNARLPVFGMTGLFNLSAMTLVEPAV